MVFKGGPGAVFGEWKPGRAHSFARQKEGNLKFSRAKSRSEGVRKMKGGRQKEERRARDLSQPGGGGIHVE